MVRIGILGCSNIAYTRFVPAAKRVKEAELVCAAEEYDKTKLEKFCSDCGVAPEESFDALIARDDIDAVYVPQPPALHYKWAKKALEAGKHVLVEKPATVSFDLTSDLVETAKKNSLALHENYMFVYHSQIAAIRKLVEEGRIGDVKMYRMSFGFPMRQANDFRYDRALGGGALLDAGGYAVKLSCVLLGDTVKVDSARLTGLSGYEVDMYGSFTIADEKGITVQASFGMDLGYQCRLEIWGSTGTLTANRIFTAGDGVEPEVEIQTNAGKDHIVLPADSHFERSIEHFIEEINDNGAREKMYKEMLLQARVMDEVKKVAESNL